MVRVRALVVPAGVHYLHRTGNIAWGGFNNSEGCLYNGKLLHVAGCLCGQHRMHVSDGLHCRLHHELRKHIFSRCNSVYGHLTCSVNNCNTCPGS